MADDKIEFVSDDPNERVVCVPGLSGYVCERYYNDHRDKSWVGFYDPKTEQFNSVRWRFARND